jgi:hypothetical protein
MEPRTRELPTKIAHMTPAQVKPTISPELLNQIDVRVGTIEFGERCWERIHPRCRLSAVHPAQMIYFDARSEVLQRVEEGSMPENASPERVPGNFYFFEMFIEIAMDGTTYLGYPKLAIRDVGQAPPVIRWGSSPKLSWPNPAIPRVPWIDVPAKGLSGRTIKSPEDMLGAEGMVGNKNYRFDQILDAGKNQVVFSLFCPENQTRTAYGFSRDMFQRVKG